MVIPFFFHQLLVLTSRQLSMRLNNSLGGCNALSGGQGEDASVYERSNAKVSVKITAHRALKVENLHLRTLFPVTTHAIQIYVSSYPFNLKGSLIGKQSLQFHTHPYSSGSFSPLLIVVFSPIPWRLATPCYFHRKTNMTQTHFGLFNRCQNNTQVQT